MKDLTARDFSQNAVDDLVLLQELSTDAMLKNLKNRYDKNLIHTYIGDVLVIVNPFKNIPGLYSTNMLEQYHNTLMHETAPHSYSIAQAAFASIERNDPNQCIVITGESGSGKTETAKHILHYLVMASGSAHTTKRVQKQILASNPVLEAFGNAQTLRNDNSSRFGKYVEVFLDAQSSRPVGARIQTFLLEKSRVVTPLDGERNFHIFYQLIAGLPEFKRKALHLRSDAASYRYLANKGLRDRSVVDAKLFQETMAALTVCGVTESMQQETLKILSAILWLGEIEFSQKGDDVDASTIVDMEPVRVAAELLAVDVDELRDSLVTRQWKTGLDVVTRHLNVSRAQHARDALSKLLYERTFIQIVHTLNIAMLCEGGHDDLRSISVLDVFGFEVHENDPNSLEQLLINYFNEKLHKMFIDRTLRLEQEEYRIEEIQWTPLDYFDNAIVCELIEKRPKSLLSLIDECELLSIKDDKVLLKKFVENLSHHARFEQVVERHVPSNTEFKLKHYAGDVRYDVTSFLAKNADTAWTDLFKLASDSSHELMRSMFPPDEKLDDKKRPPTATVQFKQQAHSLVDTMSRCAAHYVRCVKPNHQKASGIFNDAFVKHQAQYLSLLENVRLRRAGFAFRQRFTEFMHRYRMTSASTWPTYSGSDADGCERIVRDLNATSTHSFQIGKSKIFIKEPTTLFALEAERARVLPSIVTCIKSLWKGSRARRWYKQTLAARHIQRRWREHTRADRALRFRAAIRIQRAARRTLERRWRANLKKQATVLLSGKKHRRRCSVTRYFVGNYLPTTTSTPQFQEMMQSYNDELNETFFFDVGNKLNKHSGKLVERLVLVSSEALYVIEQVPSKSGEGFSLVVHRRWPLNEISQLVLSGEADNFVVVLMDTAISGVKAQHDLCLELERKTEFVAFMMSRSPKALSLATGNRIQFGNNVLRRYELSFKPDMSVKESTCVKWGGYRRLRVHVGDIRILDDAEQPRPNVVVGRIST